MKHASELERYQIWHIGDGIVNSSVWGPCFNKSDVGPGHGPGAGAGLNISKNTASTDDLNWRLQKKTDPGPPAHEVFVSASATPHGPWARVNNNAPLSINYTGSWTTTLAGNPAPLELPDGSVNLYFTATCVGVFVLFGRSVVPIPALVT